MKIYNVFKQYKALSFGFFISGIAVTAQVKPDIKSVFNRMFDSIAKVKTMSYNLRSLERTDDKMVTQNFIIKCNAAPFKVYDKNKDNGVEILYTSGDSKALVNPNGFPYADLHLDPQGKLMRENQHQTLKRAGFSYFGNIIKQNLSGDTGAYRKNVKYLGDTMWEGRACYKMEILFPDYKIESYTVKKEGETITSIAEKYSLSDYQISVLNKGLWYDDALQVGQTINIPKRYAKRTVLVISKESFLPVQIKVYDDKGIFEEYSFMNLQVNKALAQIDFSSTNKLYHF